MSVALVFDPAVAAYQLGRSHPMKPERYTLAVELARAWGLLEESPGGVQMGRARILHPRPAPDDDLLLYHTSDLVDAVRRASVPPFAAEPQFGIGPGDTPAFPDMHEAAALAVGATCLALDTVLADDVQRAFSPAGGLHHAMADRVSGFCVYNDPAIAILRAKATRPGLRVAYVDLDAHHGDGVEAAFTRWPDVLTLSVHESGRHLFPGTGEVRDTGTGAGEGATLNVPLPPGAGARSYRAVMAQIVIPALRAFRPDVIFGQIGGDSHVSDPLTHLSQTIEGHLDSVARLIDSADELCDGRIVLSGGGGYQPFSVVPRMWAGALALLLGREIPLSVPASWLDSSLEAAARYGVELSPAAETFDGPSGGVDESDAIVERTHAVIDLVRASSRLLGGAHHP